MKAASVLEIVSRQSVSEEAGYSQAKRRMRIIVRKGKSYVPVLISEVAVCYTSDKVTFVQLFSGSKYFTDYTLSDLSQLLDPSAFFRVNRRTIINIGAIREYRCISFSKIIIELIPLKQPVQQVVVSQFTAPLFKKWMQSQ